MLTDPILIERLAHEIAQRFSGARVQDAGKLEDGRLALALWKKGAVALLCADVFVPTPLLTVENGALPVAVEPGFVRSTVTNLRGKSLFAARAREGERILELDFGSHSRFGVLETYSLIFELVPRFGNIILTKDGKVVSALKEFRASGKALRTVAPGRAYEPPPSRPRRTAAAPQPDAETIRSGELYVYRDSSGALLQAHLVVLPDYEGVRVERSGSLLDLFSEVRRSGASPSTSGNVRAGALRVLEERERKLRSDLQRIDEQIAAASSRGELRSRGQQIYATLHDLPQARRGAAKAEAAELFSRYKKAAAASAHLLRRQRVAQTALSDLEALRWELERVGDEDLAGVANLIAKPRAGTERRTKSKRRSAPPQAVTPSGSRIMLGRSPLENAELTFHVAKPADLWFHARGQPGAHVILQRDDRTEPPQEDVRMAAELAAFHSKGRTSSKVTVDYTQRKHVRKRPNAAPGLVFYTGASSITVAPRDSMNIASPKEKNR